MSEALEADPLRRFLADSRKRYQKKIGISLVVAVLIEVLLSNTQWPFLRPGLIVLLVAQIALAGFWLVRLRHPRIGDLYLAIESEAVGNLRAAWFENCSRLVGFVLLGIGFWRTTGNVLVAVFLGVVYPALSFWGLMRSLKRRRLES